MRSNGFTLIEIMVAAAILAFGISAVLATFGNGLRTGQWSVERTRAILQARSRMTETLRQAAFEEMDEEGETEDGRYHWSIVVERLPEDDDEPFRSPGEIDSREPFGGPEQPQQLERYRVAVTISWPPDDPRGRVSLTTLQTQKADLWSAGS
jgi:prepilin-type N-terminal cleavage/methylation domain-containing protein